jgi:hypothetical protein
MILVSYVAFLERRECGTVRGSNRYECVQKHTILYTSALAGLRAQINRSDTQIKPSKQTGKITSRNRAMICALPNVTLKEYRRTFKLHFIPLCMSAVS